MYCVYDLPKPSLERLKRIATDERARQAVDTALRGAERRSRNGAAALKRLVIDDGARRILLAGLRKALAKEGFEGDGGDMLPIGHVYEGLIQKLSRQSACAC